jgi:integrase
MRALRKAQLVRHPERFSRGFLETVARIGRPRIRLHDLRHGWANLALEAGIHPRIVQERLGHSTISVTLGVCSHVIAGLDREAAEQVAALVSSSLAEGQ